MTNFQDHSHHDHHSRSTRPTPPSRPRAPYPAHLLIQIFRADLLLGEFRAQHLHFTDQQFADWLASVPPRDGEGISYRYIGEDGEVVPGGGERAEATPPPALNLPSFARYSAGYPDRGHGAGSERDDL